jgi:Histidine kinase-, DNA gyrase B-, and HSP90-like ATPase
MSPPLALALGTTASGSGLPVAKVVAGHYRYEMTVDLAVIESLGINLYSNAAAVLTELVANAYDADATSVSIEWKRAGDTISVTDNGRGMTVADINQRFLTVGYKKREVEGLESPKWHRAFMGRKGIGKLSVFSIAKTVFVYTKKGRQINGLKIVVADLEAAIRAGQPYHPEPVEVPTGYRRTGTTLVLGDLKQKRADLTASALRKRLARRFDVMSTTTAAQGGFKIKVDGKAITWADRQELKKLEFVWEFGGAVLPESALPKDCRRFVLAEHHIKNHVDWPVRGWIGTARRPSDLTDDPEAGSLKNIIVLARKRPIQEGIIDKLDFSRLFGNYVTGQIEADFLDLDKGYDDIATSDRQRMIEDDERVTGLRDFLRDAFLKAAEAWSRERPKKEAKELLADRPELRKWVDARPSGHREAAEKMIGTIASLPMEAARESEDRAALLRAGVLAFERIGLRDVSEDLRKLSNVTAEDLLPILGAQDSYEEALWGDILRSRVDAISEFRSITDSNEHEKVLQQHLYKNLWLFDPSWERATGSERMEQGLTKLAPGLFPKDGDEGEIKGRLDIRYLTNAGLHVIVELKRYKRKVSAEELAEQGGKYYAALASVLEQQGEADPRIQVVFVLGTPPTVKRPGSMTVEHYRTTQFAPFHGRYMLYDGLIESASKQYDEYLEASSKVHTLNDLLKTLAEPRSDA